MKLPSEAKYLGLYLDAAAYFKTKYLLIWWAAELICHKKMKHVAMSYMVLGHTKFEPDVMFSEIASKFYCTDVFNTNELASLIESCSIAAERLSLDNLRHWKDTHIEKFVDIPSITD